MRRIAREILEWLYRLPSSEVANTLAVLGICINIVLVAATTVLAIYSYRQWRAVEDTLQEIKKQTPAVIQSGSAAQSTAQSAAAEAAASDANTQRVLGEMEKQSQAAQTLANSTQAATATATKQLDLSERPSLVITETKLPAVGVNSFGNVSYDVDVLVDNTGRTPATNVALIPELSITPGFTGSVTEQLMKTCHRLDKFGPLYGEMVPQGEKGYHISRMPNFAEGGPLSSVLKNTYIDPQSGSRMVQAALVVCVLYRSTISPKVHHTALMYDATIAFSADETAKIENGSVPRDQPIVVWSERIPLHKQGILNGFAD